MSRSILSTITMAVALYGVIHFGAVGTIAATGPSSDANRIRVLLITGGHDFEQQPFYALFDSMPDVVTTKTAYPAAADLFRPELAADYDVIVFYDMWAQGITPQQQAGLVQLLQRGIGVVALHHTLAAHKDWPEYAHHWRQVLHRRHRRRWPHNPPLRVPARSRHPRHGRGYRAPDYARIDALPDP